MMKKAYTRFCFLWILALSPLSALADAFLVIYATTNGNTGHAGIAVDNYTIRIREINGTRFEDTLATGDWRYFDLWPKSDNLAIYSGLDTDPVYFDLPQSSAEPRINLKLLSTKGIPHKEGMACDGIVRLRLSTAQTLKLQATLLTSISANRPFNTYYYNCSDFVKDALEQVLGQKLDASEEILWVSSTTPNRLFLAVKQLPISVVLLDPGEKIKGTFLTERILR